MQEYWNGLSFPPPGHLPDPVIKLASPVSLTLAGRFFNTEPPGKPSKIPIGIFIYLFFLPHIHWILAVQKTIYVFEYL